MKPLKRLLRGIQTFFEEFPHLVQYIIEQVPVVITTACVVAVVPVIVVRDAIQSKLFPDKDGR